MYNSKLNSLQLRERLNSDELRQFAEHLHYFRTGTVPINIFSQQLLDIYTEERKFLLLGEYRFINISSQSNSKLFIFAQSISRFIWLYISSLFSPGHYFIIISLYLSFRVKFFSSLISLLNYFFFFQACVTSFPTLRIEFISKIFFNKTTSTRSQTTSLN